MRTTDDRPTEPEVLKVAEAAERLRISAKTAYRLAARDELPGAVRVGGRIRVSTRALDDFLERR